MNYRYFRFAEGPICEQANQLWAQLKAWRVEAHELGLSLGCENTFMYDTPPRLAGFSKPSSDLKHWKTLRNGNYWPKKNTKEGREILARIEALPKAIPVGLAVREYGIFTDHPCIIEGRTAVFPQIFGGEGLWFLMVPWAEYEPEKLAEYKRDREAGMRFSAEYDHAIWEAPADWHEVKRWEMEKEIEEYNAAKKVAV